MSKRWLHNSKTGEIESYNEEDAGYELKGVLYAYGDAITTGFKSKEEAEAWSKKWGYCRKCDGSSSPNEKGVCFRCGSEISFNLMCDSKKEPNREVSDE